MTDNQEPFRCPTCHKSYKRREHLQRHCSSSHSTSRPYRCMLCGRTFQRADVLKRHGRTCEAKAVGLADPSGGRRRACDLCVRQKKGCSLGQPCQNCRRLSVPCCYSFMDNNPSQAGTSVGSESSGENFTAPSVDGSTSAVSLPPALVEDVDLFRGIPPLSDLDFVDGSGAAWSEFLSLVSDDMSTDVSLLFGERLAPQLEPKNYSFRFLDKFTSRTGLTDSFDCGSLALRQQVISPFKQAQVESEALAQQLALAGLPQDLVGPTPSHNIGFPSFLVPQALIKNPWLCDPLMVKIHQIVARIREVVTVKPRNSSVTIEWSPVVEHSCLQFFSPANVRKFLALYWEIWHANVNFLHRPSFDPTAVKSALLASMVLLGACMSPDLIDKEDAKTWFNCVEEMVFTDDDLCAEPLYTLDTGALVPATPKRQVQALEAAYIVCLYQNWEGTDASKGRIRRHRFSTVVSVVRDIGVASARHPEYSRMGRSDFDWKDFVTKEELIRCYIWIFLLDQAFLIFNNLPPRLVTKEMRIHVAWPEACFQAGTAEECYDEIQKWTVRSPLACSITLSQVIDTVCKSGMTEDLQRKFADLGPLNLFATVSAFHTLIFHLQNSFGGEGHMAAIRNALGNWKPIWEFYSTEHSSAPPHAMVTRESLTSENGWRRIGFMRYAPEYWLLSSVIIGRLSRMDILQHDQSLWARDFSDDSLLDDNRILSKYDQTSMRQVNELITEFQKVQVYNDG